MNNAQDVEIYYTKVVNCFSDDNGNSIKAQSGIQMLKVHDCQFFVCGKQGHAIFYQSSNDFQIQNNNFTSSSNSNNNGAIFIENNCAILINGCFFITNNNDESPSSFLILSDEDSNDDFSFTGINPTSNSVLLISQVLRNTKTISITNCLFNGCLNEIYSCFNISLFTESFNFNNNIIENMISTSYKNYYGFINCNQEKELLTISNIRLINNIGKSLFGGGSSLLFY